MRAPIAAGVVLASAFAVFAQSKSLGAFTNSGDVGDPTHKGTAEFDAAHGLYRITGAGADIWASRDQFQFVWKKMTGDFTVNATLEFLGKGEDHRKAGIMVRQSLDSDSPYGDIVIHGDGMPALQWRSTKGEDTGTFDMPFDGPAKYKLRLVRNAEGLAVSIGKGDAPLKGVARTNIAFQEPVLVGLFVCGHNPKNAATVVFSDVSVEAARPPVVRGAASRRR